MTSWPLVAVTLTVPVWATEVGVPLELPPPQLTTAMASKKATALNAKAGRCFRRVKIAAANVRASSGHHGPGVGIPRNGRWRGEPAVLPAVIVSVVVPEVLTVPGMEQVTFVKGAATEQVKETVPAKLLCGVTLRVKVPELPRATLSVLELAAS